MNEVIYLDYNATTPCHPAVVETMLPYFTRQFGNAASKSHVYGWAAEEAVEEARAGTASLIHANPEEIIFTSGATEAINLAIRGVIEKSAQPQPHIITYATEHKAVLDVCALLATKGVAVTVLPVQTDGSIDVAELEAAIQPNTVLMAAMYANNETGTVLPVKEIGAIAHKHNVLFFCDGTQAAGKIAVDMKNDGVDLLSLSAHKFYGPKGIGALYIKKTSPKIALTALQVGGGHEKNLRSGTLNVPGIAGMGAAADWCKQHLEENAKQLAALRNRLWAGISTIEGVQWNGTRHHSLPNVLNVCFNFNGGDTMLQRISKYIAASSGSACSSATVQPSHVLLAMGLSETAALSSIRFSLGWPTTEEEIDRAVIHIQAAAANCRLV